MSAKFMQRFFNGIDILQQDSLSVQDKLNALVLIEKYIFKFGFTRSIIEFKQAHVLMKCVRDSSFVISIKAIDVVTKMTCKSFLCKEYFFHNGIIEVLTSYLSNDNLDLVKVALGSLIDIIRKYYKPTMKIFKKNDGIKRLAKCLRMESSAVFLNSCYLICSMLRECSLIKDELAKHNVGSILIMKLRIIDKPDDEIEVVLYITSILLRSPYCQLNKNQIRYITEILNEIIKNVDILPHCHQIAVYANALRDELWQIYIKDMPFYTHQSR